MIKKKRGKFLLASIAEDPRVNNGVRIRHIRTTSVASKMIIHLRCSRSTLTWAKYQKRIRIINPRVITNHQHLLRLLLLMFANVTFAMIPIIWQTPAHKRESISRMLKISFTQIKAF